MAKTKEQKEKIVVDLSEKLSKTKMAILSDFRGLKMDEIEELRNLSYDKSMDFKVVKTSLLGLAAKNAQVDLDISLFKDKPLAIGFGYVDEIMPAKVIYQFSRSHKKLEILGGILDGKLINAEEVKKFALLPTQEELYAKLVGSISAPISGLVNVLAGNLRGLVQVLNGYKESISYNINNN
jgi:large subunit ribosomal protein L10